MIDSCEKKRSSVVVMLSVLSKQFERHDVDKIALFGARADKNLRLVLSDNEN